MAGSNSIAVSDFPSEVFWDRHEYNAQDVNDKKKQTRIQVHATTVDKRRVERDEIDKK
jgi:hypothetical protein